MMNFDDLPAIPVLAWGTNEYNGDTHGECAWQSGYAGLNRMTAVVRVGGTQILEARMVMGCRRDFCGGVDIYSAEVKLISATSWGDHGLTGNDRHTKVTLSDAIYKLPNLLDDPLFADREWTDAALTEYGWYVLANAAVSFAANHSKGMITGTDECDGNLHNLMKRIVANSVFRPNVAFASEIPYQSGRPAVVNYGDNRADYNAEITEIEMKNINSGNYVVGFHVALYMEDFLGDSDNYDSLNEFLDNHGISEPVHALQKYWWNGTPDSCTSRLVQLQFWSCG